MDGLKEVSAEPLIEDDAHLACPEPEPSILPAPMSPTARVIFERSAAALNAAQVVWDQAQAEHFAAVNVALKLDGLPPLGMGEGELRGVSRDGDDWVEPNQPRT